MKRKRLLEVIEATPPANFCRLLEGFGFRRLAEQTPNKHAIHLVRDGDEILLPTRSDLRDYARSTLEILQIVRPQRLNVEDLVSMACLPKCDVYRHHFSDDETRFGAFPLAEFPTAVTALFDMMRFTAAGIVNARRAYKRVPPDADAFARGCRVGQTEMQSYVIKIFCPIAPETESFASTPDEPFGRLVVQACLENLEYLANEDAVTGDQAPPATLNKNVLSAVSRLRPMVFTPRAEASAWFNPWAAPVPKQFAEGTTVTISDATFTHASILERRYDPEEETDVLVVTGYIVDLHKDRPGKAQALTHEVTMDIRDGGSWRKLRMGLLPSQYRQTVNWHDRNAKVRVVAMIDKNRLPWRTLEVHSMEAFDANQGELFGVDGSI